MQLTTIDQSKKSKHARSSSSYTLNDNVLDRILGPPKEQEKKKASDNFFLQQQVRADSRNDSDSLAVPPFTVTEPARPLTEEELFVMFEGAPCFSILDGAQEYRSQVVFHGGSAGSIPTYLPDHRPLEHETFSSCTLGVDELQESELIPFTKHLRINSRRAGAGDPILEVPSMLSANGMEPGTVGLEHFLQLPIADSLAAPNEAETFERRPLLTLGPEKLGLREYDLVKLVNRLTDAGDIYRSLTRDGNTNGAPAKSTISELGESLFTYLLVADDLETPRDEDGPNYSLEAQINALQEILETKGLWHDFTLVEWRIRIGQLLWTQSDVTEDGWPRQNLSERDVFILQVTLAAELLVRLKLLQTRGQTDAVSTQAVSLDQTPRSLKVQWDLLLAETFLTNLRVSASLGLDDEHEDVMTSFFSAVSFLTSEDGPKDLSARPVFQPVNEDKQIAGLMAFAKALQWPHADSVYTQLRPGSDIAGGERPVSMVSTYATPLNSSRPLNSEDVPGTRSSYFGAMAQQNQQRPASSRMTTAQSIQLQAAAVENDGFNVGGWLSRSWLAGLVLPGEPSSHFLMSTLLENSPDAINALGDSANLYGGFAYEGRTFWSKSSCVGRVVAASSGATECMGWISSPGAPSDCPTGWVDVKVSDHPYPSSQPRIKVHGAVARASDPFHHTPANHLRAGDFTLPTDSPPVMGNEACSHGLSFTSSDAASDSSEAFTTTAHITFSSPINPKLPHISVPLTYDVHFISSHPCYPVAADNSSSSPADNNNDLTLHTTYTLNTPPPPAHPLHTSYRFMTLPVATLLSAGAEEARSRALSLPDLTAENDSEEEEEEVAVLDCRGKPDLELLARAWCAKVGENAVVGKVGRTCVACCVREARGLGVRVVVRI